MSSNLQIRLKNEDNTYDESKILFKEVDGYDGDLVSRKLEVSPIVPGTTVKSVKFKLKKIEDGNGFPFLPASSNSYELVSAYAEGLTFYLENASGQKMYPDQNGVIAVAGTLSSPLDLTIWCKVSAFTADLDQELLMEDLRIELWSKQ